MKPKAVIRLAVDVFMTLALLFLMGYQLWGEAPHEWVGAGMFLLFAAHHLLNGQWHKILFRGKYNALRTLTLCVDLLVLLAMLAQMYSGIVMSRHVFAFLPVTGGMSLARRLHILGAYWGFLLMSVHLGLHWNVILGMLRKVLKIKNKAKDRGTIAFAAGLVISVYGTWVFISRDFPTYLFLKNEFVFLDYSEPKVLFYMDYLALMGLCIFIAHYSTKLMEQLKFQKKISKEDFK